MASGVKDLKVWQEAVALAGEVVRLARQATRRETRSFTDEVMQSAVAVASGIAQGYASYAAEEQRAAYAGARRALLDLETRLSIGRHAGILQPASLAPIGVRLNAVSRLLAGSIEYLDREAETVALGLRALPQALRADVSGDRGVATQTPPAR